MFLILLFWKENQKNKNILVLSKTITFGQFYFYDIRDKKTEKEKK